jgi:hypothetical protein
MNFLVMDAHGTHTGFSSTENTQYLYMNENMSEPILVARLHVPINQRWLKKHSV